MNNDDDAEYADANEYDKGEPSSPTERETRGIHSATELINTLSEENSQKS